MSVANNKNLLNLVQDQLSQAVVVTAQQSNALLGLLPFEQTNGSLKYTYNQVQELPVSVMREIGEQVDAFDPAQVTPVTTQLAIMTNDFTVDRIFANGVGNVNDVMATQAKVNTIALASSFNKALIYGSGTNKEIKGLNAMLTDSANPMGKKFTGAVTMDLIDEALDYINISKGGDRILLMSPAMKRKVTKLMRQEGSIVSTVEMFGASVIQYDGVPVVVDEGINEGEIWVLLADLDTGVHGLTVNGLRAGNPSDAGTQLRVPLEMIGGVACKHNRAFAVIVETTRSK